MGMNATRTEGTMMKKAITIIFVLSLILAGVAVFRVSTARCGMCYSGECYNNIVCGQGCVCLKRGLDVSGYCYGSNARGDLQ